MTVRVLTIDEMLAMTGNERAVIVKCFDNIFQPGTQLVRKISSMDDVSNVRFAVVGHDQTEFFEEGEVGVVEIVDHTHTGGVSGETTGAPELGVFRPELETRKVGKIRVELVDDGFPLALREVAQVMTWAQTAKGYKDHDWQNLPNAEEALAAAASRHRTDHIKQRVVDGFDIDQCVDVESGLLHKAHEAFGVLAQLELMLRGKFVDSRHQVGL